MQILKLFLFFFIALVHAQQCNIPGICVNSEVIEVINDISEYEVCLEECKQLQECQWMSFYPDGLLCELFKTCPEIDETICHNCISSQKSCGDDDHLSKVLLISGYPYASSRNTELVDLNQGVSCQGLAQYPYEMSHGFGGLISDHLVLLCGGAFGPSFQDCYYWDLYQEIGFQKSDRPLIQSRYGGDSVVTQFGLWITGGRDINNEYLDTSEVVNLNEIRVGPKLPYKMAFHCVAKIGENVVAFSGGWNGNSYTNQTVFYDLNSETWESGPELKQAREYHSCAAFQQNNSTFLVVAGGWYNDFIASVEILDFETNRWIQGPDLPKAMGHFQMISSPDQQSVLVIGGYDGTYRNEILELICNGIHDCQWTLKQTLVEARQDFVAISIPDSYDIHCTNNNKQFGLFW